MIYLDNASTTKTSEEVLSEIIYCQNELFGNPSSTHFYGKIVNEKVFESREIVANLIHCNSSEIYFNSGSTEGVNTILRGFVEANINSGNHIITTKTEHKAVLEACVYLENIGVDVTYLDVDEKGLISLMDLKSSITVNTILVSILWVNNETGIIQDIDSISKIVTPTKAKLFVDATQAIGKIPVDVKHRNIDMLCMSGHKFHGPKGIGALYIKEGVVVSPLLYGGGQEKGIRSGTTNVSGVMGLAKACKLAEPNNVAIAQMIHYLEKKLVSSFDCKVVGDFVNRSEYILNVIFSGIDADLVISKLKKVVISSGSACTSRIIEPSHVLKSMGYTDEESFSSLRFSISRYTTYEEIDAAIEELIQVIN